MANVFRILRRLWVVLGCLLAASELSAQVIFEPSIGILRGYNNRADPVDNSSGGESYWAGGINLPVMKSTSRSSFSLQFQAGYQEFDDQLNSEFNDWNYRGSMAFSRRLSSRGIFSLDLNASRQQGLNALGFDQGIDQFQRVLQPRHRAIVYGVGVNYRRELRPRWAMSLNGRYTGGDFEEIRSETDTPPLSNDRGDSSVGIGFFWRATERSSFGPSYEYVLFDSSGIEDREEHRLALNWNRRIDQRSSISIGVGTSLLEISVPAGQPKPDTQDSLFGTLSLNRSFQKLDINFNAAHRLSNRDPFSSDVGRATDAGFNIGSTLGRFVSWQATLGWRKQEDSFIIDTQRQDIETVRAGLSLAVPIPGRLALRLDGQWIDLVNSTFDVNSFYSVQLGLGWLPLGSSRIGSLGRLRRSGTDSGLASW